MTQKIIVLLIFSMTSLLVSSLDIYVPASPQLAVIFGVPESVMKLTFLIGPLASGIVGIPAGYFSDRYGRRPFLLLGLLIYWIGTLLCTASPSIDIFFIGRFLQSFGIGGLMVISSAILSDLFKGVALARYMGLFAMLFPIAFAIAPILGAHIFAWFGWRAMFGTLLLGITPVAFALAAFLPETCESRQKSPLLPLLKEMAASKLTLSLALVHAVPITISVIFTANATFLYQNLYGFDPVAFSFVQAVPVAIQSLGTLFYRWLVQRIGLEQALAIGFRVAACYSAICLLMMLDLIRGPWVTVGAVCLFSVGGSFVITSSLTLALDYSKTSKGLTSSFISLTRNIVIGIVATGASFLPHYSAVPIFSAMLVVSFTTMLLILMVQQQLKATEPLSPSA